MAGSEVGSRLLRWFLGSVLTQRFEIWSFQGKSFEIPCSLVSRSKFMFTPHTFLECTTPETLTESPSKSVSTVVIPKVGKDNSHLRKRKSNAAYEAVAELDTASTRKTRNSVASGAASGKRSPSIFTRIAARILPAESPPKVSPKSSSVAEAVLGFFTARNTPNEKSLEPESSSPIQRSQERPREDFPD
ncbi:hypothetical protein OUZ56_025555 [Daphnia magna]|uniref:Uncharacterized protein n=1 Tax=Daphnia magna TaxID=35525 RepID=A0ABQ9ZK77_9CRUS|nr:hypothetical protein OUZ56_025555 [Daphnia magna]